MNSRNPSLDVLRGVAVLLVLGYHAQFPAFRIGWSGVDLFFVLSGFLISGLLFSDYKKFGHIRLGRFWFRRAFKILPSLYSLLATLILITIRFGKWHQVSHIGYLGSALFFYNYLPLHTVPIIARTWSLAVEEHFTSFSRSRSPG